MWCILKVLKDREIKEVEVKCGETTLDEAVRIATETVKLLGGRVVGVCTDYTD